MYAETVIHRGWVEAELFHSPGSSLDALDVYRELTVAPTKGAKRAMLQTPTQAGLEKATTRDVRSHRGGIEGYTIISMGPSNDPMAGGQDLRRDRAVEARNVVDVFMTWRWNPTSISSSRANLSLKTPKTSPS